MALSPREQALLGQSAPAPSKPSLVEEYAKTQIKGEHIADHVDDLNEEIPDDLFVSPDEYYADRDKFDTKHSQEEVQTYRTNLRDLVSGKITKQNKGKRLPQPKPKPKGDTVMKRTRGGKLIEVPAEPAAEQPRPQPAPQPKPRVAPQPEVKMQDQEDKFAALNAAMDNVDQAMEPEPQGLTAEQFLYQRAVQILAEQGIKDPVDWLTKFKEKYGRVSSMSVFGDKVFFYQYLPRSVWKRIQSQQRAFADKGRGDDELMENLKRNVIQSCLLYPSFQTADKQESFYTTTEAGLVDSLYEAIMLSSSFFSPQQIMNLTVKL